MPIIKSKQSIDTSSIKAQVNPAILEQIENYCQWAGIYDLGYFIEKSALDLFAKDAEWNLYLKQLEQCAEIAE
ncbi:MAG: hypothetical protein BGO90_12665 [Legionella sp. 40-6]|nr:hypothetical protein [Legionella sp.]OJY36151.1 MAG: hypothetical protein BGO90_12665 [Legionella sp. 40-6]